MKYTVKVTSSFSDIDEYEADSEEEAVRRVLQRYQIAYEPDLADTLVGEIIKTESTDIPAADEQLSTSQEVVKYCQVAKDSLTKAGDDLSALLAYFDKDIIKVNGSRVVNNAELNFLVFSIQHICYIEQIKEWVSSLEESAKKIHRVKNEL